MRKAAILFVFVAVCSVTFAQLGEDPVLTADPKGLKETIWTAPLDAQLTKCAVTNASSEDLRVVIRILDAFGRTDNPNAPRPVIHQMTTGEVVRDSDGYPTLVLDVVLPPGGSDGVFRDRIPAGSVMPPTSCKVQAERMGVTRVSYCEQRFDRAETINCMQAP